MKDGSGALRPSVLGDLHRYGIAEILGGLDVVAAAWATAEHLAVLLGVWATLEDRVLVIELEAAAR